MLDFLSIRPLGTNFSAILIKMHNVSFTKMHLKIWSAKWWPFCLGLNVLNGTSKIWIKCIVSELWKGYSLKRYLYTPSTCFRTKYLRRCPLQWRHKNAIASQITGVSIICSNVCSGANQREHQSSASLVFVRGIHRWPVDSPHKGPVTRKMFPFDDVTMHVTDLVFLCVIWLYSKWSVL